MLPIWDGENDDSKLECWNAMALNTPICTMVAPPKWKVFSFVGQTILGRDMSLESEIIYPHQNLVGGLNPSEKY